MTHPAGRQRTGMSLLRDDRTRQRSSRFAKRKTSSTLPQDRLVQSRPSEVSPSQLKRVCAVSEAESSFTSKQTRPLNITQHLSMYFLVVVLFFFALSFHLRGNTQNGMQRQTVRVQNTCCEISSVGAATTPMTSSEPQIFRYKPSHTNNTVI